MHDRTEQNAWVGSGALVDSDDSRSSPESELGPE